MYVEYLAEPAQLPRSLTAADSQAATAQRLINLLRSVSAQAWNKTESLLANEMQRHRIQPQLVDPWAIAKDVHYIYEKTLQVYVERATHSGFLL